MVNKAVIIVGAAVGVVVIILAILYGMYFSGFNAAQSKDENVRRLAGDIDVQLQRRYDLIPNLVNTAQSYLQFEKSVLENVTRLRTDWQRAPTVNERVQTSNQLEEALSKILVTYESYPELKADRTLTRLMDELAGTENRIAVARTYYNDGVRDFNVHLRTFPNNVFNESGFLGLGPWNLEPYTPYEATAAARANVPQVNIQVP
ncbi:LemA family protein [Nitrososphaera sp.]|uniref:LemA family protein n=1 Tax=Nitrososphaera sp. TaxID=1971748 RepID=UPI00307DCE94